MSTLRAESSEVPCILCAVLFAEIALRCQTELSHTSLRPQVGVPGTFREKLDEADQW